MTPRERRHPSGESGTTLIETAIACSILVVAMIGLLGMLGMATSITENEGHLSARTSEYAVDKLEQLLELTYGDTQSDTTLFPSVTSGGTGLAIGGSSDPAAPAAGYADWLDADGKPLCSSDTPCGATPPSTWYYARVWQVAQPSDHLKLITVTSTIKNSVGGALKAKSTFAAYKSDCPAGC
jgi:hypothetical protein